MIAFTLVNSNLPANSATIAQPISITAGDNHTCALLSDKSVVCWGDDSLGQLGDGTNQGSSTPVEVQGLGAVTSIAAGGNHTCAIKTNKTVACWGSNSSGELGDNTFNFRKLPVTVSGLSGIKQISAGRWNTCALTTDGYIYCWGNASRDIHVLGDYILNPSPIPVLMPNISNAVNVGVGAGHICALLKDKTVWCWGSNVAGALGAEGPRNQFGDQITQIGNPIKVEGVANVSSLSVGGSSNCVLIASKAKCWGDNMWGQTGIDRNKSWGSYIVISPESGRNDGLGLGLQDVQAGSWYYTCALRKITELPGNNSLTCWGQDQFGVKLAIDPTVDSPIADHFLVGIMKMTVGLKHGCAILYDQTIKCWGDNLFGQLGNGKQASLGATYVAGFSTPQPGAATISFSGAKAQVTITGLPGTPYWIQVTQATSSKPSKVTLTKTTQVFSFNLKKGSVAVKVFTANQLERSSFSKVGTIK